MNSVPNIATSPTQEPILNISHLRLLHQFITSTSHTLVVDPEAAYVYHTYMLKIAFDFPFLLQAMLAIAALHLSRLDQIQRREYLNQAERHHDAALTQFRNEVGDIDDGNFEAVLCFATLLSLYTSAFPINDPNGPEYVLDSILQNMALTRRVRPMVSTLYSKMLASELGRLVPADTRGINFDEIPQETELVKLRQFSEATRQLYPPDINEAYSSAIRCLEVIFATTEKTSKPPSDGLIKIWVHHASERFMELLSEKQPGALIIFAHYAVLFERSRHYWYFEGVAAQILYIAESMVPSEWAGWLDWPREQIGISGLPQNASTTPRMTSSTDASPR